MKFWSIFLCEFAQNLLLTTGFFLAFQFHQQGKLLTAGICVLIAGTSGALYIRFIECKGKKKSETWRMTLINMGALPLLMESFLLALTLPGTNIYTDILIGLLGGTGLALGQQILQGNTPDWARMLAFACAFPLTLESIRWLAPRLPLCALIALSALLVSLVIVLLNRPPASWIKIPTGKPELSPARSRE